MQEKYFISPTLIHLKKLGKNSEDLLQGLEKIGCGQAGRLLTNSNWEEGEGDGILLTCKAGGACIAHRYGNPQGKFDKGLSHDCPAGLSQEVVVGTVFNVDPREITKLLNS